MLQNQKSKITFFLLVLKQNKPRLYKFWKFQIQGPNNQLCRLINKSYYYNNKQTLIEEIIKS